MSTNHKPLFGLNDRLKAKLADQVVARTRKKFTELDADDSLPASRQRSSQSIVSDSLCRFDQLPGYQQIRVIEQGGQQLGVASPFFKAHEGVAGATTRINRETYINFASYNYLNFCGHSVVNQAAQEAIVRYGTSASASRMVSGERPVQQSLERALADFYEVDDCVVMVSGHATNVTTIGYLFGQRDLIIHDALIHNSVVQGALLSGAQRLSFPHNDWQALDRLLQEQRVDFERVLIVLEGIYSMDGDYPDLLRFVEIKQRHKAFLMVDEAHSLGVMGKTGRGIREHFSLEGKAVDIWMGTLSKTLSGCGGYIAGEKALVHHLRISAPGFLYSVGLSPPLAAASLAALNLLAIEPERVTQLQANGQLFLQLCREKGVDTGYSTGLAVIPAILGGSARSGMMANKLFEQGINVQPIFYPAVEEGMARLRFFMSSAHTAEQIRYTVDTLAALLRSLK